MNNVMIIPNKINRGIRLIIIFSIGSDELFTKVSITILSAGYSAAYTTIVAKIITIPIILSCAFVVSFILNRSFLL